MNEFPDFRPLPPKPQARARRRWYIEMKPIWRNFVIQGGDPNVIVDRFGVGREVVRVWQKELKIGQGTEKTQED